MIFRTIILALLLFFSTVYALEQTNEVDKLLEQASHSSTPEEKKELIEKLKKELAYKNKKTQEQADAIIEAKKKVPIQLYTDNLKEE